VVKECQFGLLVCPPTRPWYHAEICHGSDSSGREEAIFTSFWGKNLLVGVITVFNYMLRIVAVLISFSQNRSARYHPQIRRPPFPHV
jgi:hypothetical protein